MASNSALIERHFINIPIPGLGDCFYETLRLYGKLYNVPQLNHSVSTLRTYVHSTILSKKNTNEEFQIALLGPPSEHLGEILKRQKYLNDANIAAVQLAYRIFNVNIVFYNVDANGLRIDRYPERIDPRVHTLHIIRKDDIHFELLIPMGDPIQLFGFAETIRDARLEADKLEIERDTLIALIVDGQLNESEVSVNNEFKRIIKMARAKQADAIQQASELMVDPENQQAAREASIRVLSIFHRNHANHLANAMQELRVSYEPGARNQPAARNLLLQEESNAAFAARLAQEELNAANAAVARQAQERSNAVFAASLAEKPRRKGPRIAAKLAQEEANAAASRQAQERSSAAFAAKLAQEEANAAAARQAQEASNAAFAARLAQENLKPKKRGPRIAPKKGGTQKRRGHMRSTKKLKKRSV